MNRRIQYLPCAIIVFLFLLISSAGAVSITDTAVNPHEVWEGDNTDIQVTCAGNASETLTALSMTVTDPIDQHIDMSSDLPEHTNNTTVSITYTPPKLGSYTAELSCTADYNGSTATDTKHITFISKRLEVRNLQIVTDPVYTDSELEFRFNIFENRGGTEQEITDPNQIDISMNLPGWTRNALYYDAGTWILKGSANLKDTTYDTQLGAALNEHHISEQFTLPVKHPFRVELASSPNSIVPGDTITIDAQAWYREHQVSLSNISIQQATINEIPVPHRITDNAIELDIPTMDADTAADLTLVFQYDGKTYTLQRSVAVRYRISGTLTNADGTTLTGRMRVTGDTVSEEHVFNDGTYDIRVPQGAYTVTVQDINNLPQITLNDVTVSASMDNVLRLDNPGTLDIKGVSVFGAAGVELVPTFTDAQLTISYNPDRARSEEHLTVFHCTSYNLDSRYCSGNWNAVQASIDTVRNFASVDTATLGGFIVGRREGLRLDTSIKDTYRIRDEITLQGAVKNENGKPVQDATVTATLADKTVTAKTGKHGGFELTLQTPQEEGQYEFTVQAENPPYRQDTISRTLQATAERSLTLSAPESITAAPGVEKRITVTMTNTGQVPLHNVDITASVDCRNCNYSHTPKTVKRIDTGKKQDISLTVEIPEDAGGELVAGTVTASNDDVSSEASFAVSVQETLNDNITSTSSGADGDGATGYLTALPALSAPDISMDHVMGGSGDLMSTLNIVSLILAVLVLGYVKLADHRSGNGGSTGGNGAGNERYRLEKLKEEAMKSVTITGSTDTADTPWSTPGKADEPTAAQDVAPDNTENDDTNDTRTDDEESEDTTETTLEINDSAHVCHICGELFESERKLEQHKTRNY